MKIGSHVVFSTALNWPRTQWIAQELILERPSKIEQPIQDKKFEVQEFYDEEICEGMSRRPKPRICQYFFMGKCYRGNLCRSRHVEEETQERRKWADEDPEEENERWERVEKRRVCKFFGWGKCKKGESCEFRHEEHTGEGDGADRPSQYQKRFHPWKLGDWECSACGDHQFSKNEYCKMCERRGVQSFRPFQDPPGTQPETPTIKRWLKKQEEHAEVVLSYLCEKCVNKPSKGCTVCQGNTKVIKT